MTLIWRTISVFASRTLARPGFLAERAASIRALLADRLQITADDKLLTPEWGAPEALIDRRVRSCRASFPGVPLPGKLGISADMFPYDPMHQTFVNIYEDGELTRQMILNRVHESRGSRGRYAAGRHCR